MEKLLYSHTCQRHTGALSDASCSIRLLDVFLLRRNGACVRDVLVQFCSVLTLGSACQIAGTLGVRGVGRLLQEASTRVEASSEHAQGRHLQTFSIVTPASHGRGRAAWPSGPRQRSGVPLGTQMSAPTHTRTCAVHVWPHPVWVDLDLLFAVCFGKASAGRLHPVTDVAGPCRVLWAPGLFSRPFSPSLW